MNTSIGAWLKKIKPTHKMHLDFSVLDETARKGLSADTMGFVVEHLVMTKFKAKDTDNFANEINSPGLKKIDELTNAQKEVCQLQANQIIDEFKDLC